MMRVSKDYDDLLRNRLGDPWRETVSQPLYDYETFDQSTLTKSFFVNPRSDSKWLDSTNLDLAGRLPPGQRFLINAFRVYAPRDFANGASLQFMIGTARYLAVPLNWVLNPLPVDVALMLESGVNFTAQITRREPVARVTRVGVVLLGHLQREVA